MLLHQIHCPTDVDSYNQFTDFGFSNTAEWQGHKNLSWGYWVYVAPYWYIWRDQKGAPEGKIDRAMSALGSPDKKRWSSPVEKTVHSLLVETEMVHPVRIEIQGRLSEGALASVWVYDLEGGEPQRIWQKGDAMTLDEDRGVIVLPCRVNHKVTRMLLGFPDPIKGYPSCEIDSVGFVDRAGKTWWAESAQPGVLMPGQRPAE